MEGFKYTDIEKIFAQKVANYISQGYVFHNPHSIGDELVKVDLEKDCEDKIIRIVMLRKSEMELDYEKEFYSIEQVSLVVGSYKKSNWHSIFNDELDVIEQIDFYTHSYDADKKTGYFFTDKNVAIKMFKKSYARHKARHIYEKEWETNDASAKVAVLPFIRRQYRCKTKTADDIVKIVKCPREERHLWGNTTAITTMHYSIYLSCGKKYEIGYHHYEVEEGA